VSIRAIAAANIAPVVSQPKKLRAGPLTRRPMIARLLAISMRRICREGVKNPLIIAVQKRASIGFTPLKLMSMPIDVETAMTP